MGITLLISFHHIDRKEIILLDMVKFELEKGNDELFEWILEQNFEECTRLTQEIVGNYAKVMNYIRNCGYYNERGLLSWAQNDVADPWVIATALAYRYTVVTFENSSAGLNVKTKTGRVKIPDVAAYFGVECVNLYEMMRRLKFVI